MHRRFFFPLAAGVVGLLAFSPVLAAQPSLSAAEPGPAKATTTTAPADDSSAPSDSDSADSGSPDSGSGDSGTGASSTTATTGKGSSATTATTGKGGSTATTGKGGSTATTAPGSGTGSSSADCGQPETDRTPAPQVGDAPQTFQAGEAGEVQVERLSQSELRIAKASPNDGWAQTVTAPSGSRVNVRFTRQGQSPSLIRFAASMDQAGQELHVRVTTCG